ncbi:MAG: calcium/sodium antiporter [Eubacterium sp.]|nr:calcium/sodium antiporter [Eubacterium sp.]
MAALIPTFLLLIVGFVLLIKGADFFVEGSASIARKLRVPSLIVGMTIVAMGTSLPECSVSINASMTGENSLAVSNVLGSNIFNLMVVCGVCALFAPLVVKAETRNRDITFSILCAVLLGILGFLGMELERMDGWIFLVIFILFLFYMVMSALKARAGGQEIDEGEEYAVIPVWKSILFIAGGAAAIAFGGDFVVKSASKIATTFGMSQTLVGLTICAIGTSLPELVTSVVAARKKQVDMALGNVIGSNIFNILFVLGISSSISPIAVITENLVDVVLLILMSLVVWIFTWTKERVNRAEGAGMVLLYIGYWVYICIR